MKSAKNLYNNVKEGRMTLETAASSLLTGYVLTIMLDFTKNNLNSWILIAIMFFIYLGTYGSKAKVSGFSKNATDFIKSSGIDMDDLNKALDIIKRLK
jgi:hypothetical protein